MPHRTRVALADDHRPLRGRLRKAVETATDMRVIGEAATGPDALVICQTLRPDVIVVDVEMAGGMDGVEVTAHLASGPCRVLACSAHDDPVLVASLLRAGADGFLAKADVIARLPAAVRAVRDGRGRWFGGEPAVRYVVSASVREALDHFAGGGWPGALGRPRVQELCAAFDAVSWYEALARAWGAGLVGGVAEGGGLSRAA